LHFLYLYIIINFVLTKYKFKFHKNLHCDEKFIFKTSPCDIHGVSFIRDFIVEDSNGNLCCESSSSWVIIDFEKRSILRPNRLPLPITADSKLVDFLPDRISTNVREGILPCYNTTVTYSQLDANNHLNNCNYADIMTDGIYALKNEVPFIRELDMSFDHEAAVGSELGVVYDFGNDECIISCYNKTSGLSCFTARIVY